jgi:hypothetical protein
MMNQYSDRLNFNKSWEAVSNGDWYSSQVCSLLPIKELLGLGSLVQRDEKQRSKCLNYDELINKIT